MFPVIVCVIYSPKHDDNDDGDDDDDDDDDDWVLLFLTVISHTRNTANLHRHCTNNEVFY